jgi:hypothetical protein
VTTPTSYSYPSQDRSFHQPALSELKYVSFLVKAKRFSPMKSLTLLLVKDLLLEM